jgi:hypothetical protein
MRITAIYSCKLGTSVMDYNEHWVLFFVVQFTYDCQSTMPSPSHLAHVSRQLRHVACMSSLSPVLNDTTSVYRTYINQADPISLQTLNGGCADWSGRANAHTVFGPSNNGILTYLLMELGPSWEAANCAATQELPSALWNPKVHYRLHKSPPLDPILSQIDLIPTIPSYLSKIHFNIVHPPTSWSKNGIVGSNPNQGMDV